jgi:predicted nucleotide-binding protein
VVFSLAMRAAVGALESLIERGYKLADEDQYKVWERRAKAFLLQAFGEAETKPFSEAGGNFAWSYRRDVQVGTLEGMSANLVDGDMAAPASPGVVAAPPSSKKVFVVHGHDNAAKETVARFLERLNLEPVILHEKPNEGRTVIEKFEHHADVRFAVVLLTPDDVGALATEASTLKPRARQNVVLELGYFLGSLRRSRVCALYRSGVEIPSDYPVLYIELDEKGAWRTGLAQELSNAGLKINLEALLKS